jgi:hypothetical protein
MTPGDLSLVRYQSPDLQMCSKKKITKRLREGTSRDKWVWPITPMGCAARAVSIASSGVWDWPYNPCMHVEELHVERVSVVVVKQHMP